MNREEKAFKRMFRDPKKSKRPDYPSRTMRIVISEGECELVWKLKYGVWFLIAVSKGFYKYFRHAPITGKAFKMWANRNRFKYSWLAGSTAKELQLFID